MSTSEMPVGRTWEELIVMRGEVIHSFASVEMGLSAYISQHFFGNDNFDFIHTVLYDPSVSFIARLNIFEKISRSKGFSDETFFKKLRDLGRIRNTFAHAWVSSPNPKEEKFNLIGKAGMKDKYDAVALHKAFFEHFEEVQKTVTRMLRA